MNTREKIIAKIEAATNKLEKKSKPIDYSKVDNKYSMQDFEQAILSAGGKLTQLSSLAMLSQFVKSTFLDIKNIVSLVDEVSGNNDLTKQLHQPVNNRILDAVELVVIRGGLAVKENGAIWIDCEKLPHPSLPFITPHLMIVLENCEYVDNMYQAYHKIKNMPSYGIFITGPSKTADIERCTVIGAHGPISLNVIAIVN